MTRQRRANQCIDPFVFSPARGVRADIGLCEIFLSLAERQTCPQPRCVCLTKRDDGGGGKGEKIADGRHHGHFSNSEL